MPENEPIDRAALVSLLAMVNGDRAFVQEMIDVFLSDAARLIGEMRRAAESGQAEPLRRAAHSLKSNSANLGAPALRALCLEMETLGRDGQVAGAAGPLAQAEAELERVRTALQMVRVDEL